MRFRLKPENWEFTDLCNKGFAIEDPLKSSPDEISRLASWIESKLVICYLKLGQPGLALHHSHRSIIQNPSHFCNHLRQAACFRCLHRYSEAASWTSCVTFGIKLTGRSLNGTSSSLATEPLLCRPTPLSAFVLRSAMVAHCLYAMTQEAVRGEVSFSVLYTPFEKKDKADKIKEANKAFAEKHPYYAQHIFTDPHGIHLLPEKAESHPGQQYLLTLGFRNREIGKTVEKFSSSSSPNVLPDPPKKTETNKHSLVHFLGQKITFSPSMEEEAETFWQNTGKGMMAAVAFIGSSKIKDERGPCARAIEQFHHASLLRHLQRGEEHAQVMAQAMAELATAPYLQRVSREDDKLRSDFSVNSTLTDCISAPQLQSLMADAMDILAGRTGERVWTKIQKDQTQGGGCGWPGSLRGSGCIPAVQTPPQLINQKQCGGVSS
ncbi:hypothetical protein DV515_00016806 [Chloebia gouldiae]|uniref:Uncharacterized protein n=1 Tax=Chloebia gouldiae TaxID=44316 RepID=A0A3L8RAA8_CHLGU|nr:hypothetical protein DV515_00016806 [Chloebia gouldiae]